MSFLPTLFAGKMAREIKIKYLRYLRKKQQNTKDISDKNKP